MTESSLSSSSPRGAPLGDSSKFKNDQNGYRTKALFLETSYLDKTYILYSLSPHNKEVDGIFLPSLYRLYLDLEDPTEFHFANLYFDGMEHWRRVCEATWFKPFLNAMRNDLRLKIKNKAIEGLKEEAYNPNSKNRFAALKYLADSGYLDKAEKIAVGRPKKEKMEEALSLDYKEAYDRVFSHTEGNA